jgi:CRP-like cAMP-binding protein/Fe-S-cluster-containing dehydrogenase component
MSSAPVAEPKPKSMKMMQVTIDGKSIEIEESATIFEAACRLNIDIPVLCHRRDLGLNPVAVCRACLVEVEGERGPYAASCARPCETLADRKTGKSKEVHTHTEPVEKLRKTLLEMLLAEHPRPCKQHQETQDCELELLGEKYGLLKPLREQMVPTAKFKSIGEKALTDDYGEMHTQFQPRLDILPPDISNLSIAVDHSACILCDRCVRACGDVAVHHIIGRMGKGSGAKVGFDNNKLMAESGCVNCGWCMVACPTGALVYTGKGRTDGFDDALTVAEMDKLPFMQNAKVPFNFLRRLEGGIRRRNLKAGELICRQGDKGNTAFYIESGKANIYLELEKPAKVATSLFKKILHPALPTAVKQKSDKVFGIVDAGVDLSEAKILATVPESATSVASRLVGEASCRNGAPRSATVRAAEDMVLLEMTRDVLDVLLRSPGFREEFERTKRSRMIQNYVRSAPIFAQLPQAELEWLEQQAQMITYRPGQPIFKEGETGDAFYVIRLGYVKIMVGSEVISYVGRGQYFGEISLMRNMPRTATCVAMDNVEALRMSKASLLQLLERQPQIGVELNKEIEARLGRNSVRSNLSTDKRVVLDQYVKQELFEGQSLLVIDLDLCTRCDECVKACAQSHGGVSRMVRDGNRFQNFLVPKACRSCHDPKCLSGCPVDAIHRTKEGGLAIIIEDHCVGCGFCFGEDKDKNPTGTGCPYGNIFPVPVTRVDPVTKEETVGRKASVCDLDNCTAEKQEPSCVYACPHQAAKRVDADKFFGQPLLRVEV